ncbi:MAG TPA: DUF86 domain-containing protein [Pseudogracilibacillus sp.]|nr:DUF86 domain-containing protein [Pseudogracilibacillus sp.]
MYFVNRSEIEETVEYIQHVLKEVEQLQATNNDIEKFALERMTHVIIESILDVGNMMIDGFIMRDPGSYHDIIDILIDERVIPKDEEEAYKSLIDLRQELVQNYTAINHAQFIETFKNHMATYLTFQSRIHTYLKNELDVANAFSNEE